MFYNAKYAVLQIDDTQMEYVSFGEGSETLILLPGLGDGLRTMKGTKDAIALMYKDFAKKYKVYVFSRKTKLPVGYTTKDMARDQVAAMKILGIGKAMVIGVSQGGMIAQYMAIIYPKAVEKLVLAVSIARQNELLRENIMGWIEMAGEADYKGIFIDTAEKSYSQKKLKAYRPLYPVLTKVAKTKDFARFIVQANACLTHNSYDELDKIQCPTLIIAGGNDKIVGGKASNEMGEKISGSKLIVHKGLGHGLYDESNEFIPEIVEFLKE